MAINNRSVWHRICIFLLFVVACCLLCACGKDNQTSEVQQDTEDDRIKIGFSFDSFVIERWQRDREIFVSTAKELGADVNVQSANGDIEEQKKQIEYFIDSKMDVIVIVCIDSDGLSDAVADAKAAGIKVIAYDRLIRNADVDLYVSFDNAMVGTLMANAIRDAGVTNGKVVMLGGDWADYNVPQLEQAFTKGMSDCNNEIVGAIHAQGWKPEIASDYIYDHFELIEKADAIMCGNDLIASGVIDVCEKRGLKVPEDVSVVGFDDIPLAEELKLSTIRQERKELGRCAFFTLDSLMSKISVSKTMLRPQFIERETIAKAAKRK